MLHMYNISTHLCAMHADDEQRVGEPLQERDCAVLDLDLARGLAHAQQAASEEHVAVLRELRHTGREAHAARTEAAGADAAHAHDAA